MSIDVEFGLKSEIRNNPVVREVDVRQRRALRRIVLLVGLVVGLSLFTVWPDGSLLQTRQRIEQLRLERAQEREENRRLRLNLEVLRSAHQIEPRARELGLRPATLADTIVLERMVDPMPADGVLALAH